MIAGALHPIGRRLGRFSPIDEELEGVLWTYIG